MGEGEARQLIERLERDARQLAERFGLRYRTIEAERASVRRRYGICFADGTIRIRLRHTRTRQPLKYSSLVNTLCHELAHLRHFNHGPRFKAFYLRILDYARSRGIYRPGPLAEPAAIARAAGPPPRPAPSQQLSLF
jgi:predicted metal-dependent hydrolase